MVQVHLGPPPRTPRPAARPVAPANTFNPHRAVVQVEVATLQGSQLAPPETMRTQWLPVQAPSLKSTSTYRLVLQALRQPGVHFADVVFYECHMPVVIEQPAFDPWDMYWLFVDGGQESSRSSDVAGRDLYRRTWRAAAFARRLSVPADDKSKGKEISLLATFNV